MRFEHLIQVNDPLSLLIEPLTRAQLWRGLMLRAEQPCIFMEHLDGARIVARGEWSLARELDFGSFKVRDRVRLEPMQRIVIETEAAQDRGVGTLSVSIEEPGNGLLQLRFEYRLERVRMDDAAQEAMYDQFIKSAYIAADIDCVRIIRQRVAEEAWAP
ncbi:MAG: SRPBCC family protein [Steroidobacteraceae bacterium]